jgi:peptidyl-prolyl cis-trans isomerase C
MMSAPIAARPHFAAVVALAMLGLASLAGCGEHPQGALVASVPAAANATVETVNGEAVSKQLLDVFVQSRRLDVSTPQLRARALDQIADLMLIEQATRKAGHLNDPEFAAMAELGRLQGISVAAARAFQKETKANDAAVRAEYDRQTATGNKEYDFGEILFATREEAAKAIGEISASRPFDQVLHAHGKDSRMARTFSKARDAQLPPAIRATLGSLKPGETTREPVQLEQGWAVVHLAAVNVVASQPFDQAKDKVRYMLVRRMGEERLAKLRKEATITVNEVAPVAVPPTPAPAKAMPATPAPAKSPL